MLSFELATPRRIFYAGEVVAIRLHSSDDFPAGRAGIRTNIGMAAIHRREIIEDVELGKRPTGRDWHDISMKKADARTFKLELMLTEIGVFELKPFFLPEDSHGEPLWPDGGNTVIKVETAENIGANLMYTAFVRQFGPNREKAHSCADPAGCSELDRDGYTVIPPSGHFRDLVKQLDFIFGKLGCRILQLLPIHPTPTVYGRMGRFGSPFAALDYFAVDPALAEFDPTATPLEQFLELVDAVHRRKGRIFLDIPVNHTGWASRLQTEHPEWFVRDAATGRLESPGAWGIVWADLCKLDYEKREVQLAMADVFLYWCRLGVDGFRCDAGYMLPEKAWYYIEAKVRSEYPDTVFMLEGLGGPLDKQEKLLKQCGLDWGYSELFQNYRRDEIERYVSYASRSGREAGTLINFAETHDNNRLAGVSKVYAKMRCALMVFLSDGGAFGFTNGVEWFASEKVDVHGNGGLNWGNPENMVDFLKRLHGAMRLSPAFYGGAEKRLENLSPSQALAVRRSWEGTASLLGLVNLDCEHASEVVISPAMLEGMSESGLDLLSGQPMTFEGVGNNWKTVLAPGECRLFSDRKAELEALEEELKSVFRTPEIIRMQKLKLAAERAWLAAGLPVEGDAEEARKTFHRDWRRLFQDRPIAEYSIEDDEKRLVMIPPGWCLAIHGKNAFRVTLKNGNQTLRFERSVRLLDQTYVALFSPLGWEERPKNDALLELTVFEPERTVRKTGHIRYLPPAGQGKPIQMHFNNNELADDVPRHALLANDLGGYAQLQAKWGNLVSKYDALLAANLDLHVPVDRRILWVRCRAWVVLNGFSQELSFDTQQEFLVGTHNLACWKFALPVGQGRMIRLDVICRMANNANAVELEFHRRAAGNDLRMLSDATAVKLIVRPDLDDRVNHEVTKAYCGAEQRFPQAVHAGSDCVTFAPGSDRKLVLTMPHAEFHRNDEWHYMQDFPLENYYGLEHKSDLYSPGYFETELAGRSVFTLTGQVNPEAGARPKFPERDEFPEALDAMQAAENALQRFVVKRDTLNTVIAGYPWFLDWGRDTLIALRGLIAAGRLEESKAILLAFAGLEKKGTIPNMIRGSNDSNRDTSDAPLWLAVAVRDYVEMVKDTGILETPVGKAKRPLLEVLRSIACSYQAGTENGIIVDRESNLVFSPPHFTWMDTNYPAASPREGYPIEIQALWFALQSFLGRFDAAFAAQAEATRKSIAELFWLPEENYLSDCLHGARQTRAAAAVRDNALRPNQLFAVTLGVVKDEECRQEIVRNSGKLMIPGAMRSLGTDRVIPPLPVELHGKLLNNPDYPYQGHYCGPEDTQRKVAYHNGTAWCWPFPTYVEALYMTYGELMLPAARTLLESSSEYFNGGCPGQLPEVADGDYPHHWGGCAAQAWSVCEFYRVGKLLGL